MEFRSDMIFLRKNQENEKFVMILIIVVGEDDWDYLVSGSSNGGGIGGRKGWRKKMDGWKKMGKWGIGIGGRMEMEEKRPRNC